MTIEAPPQTIKRQRVGRRRRLRIAHVVGAFTTGGGGITLRNALALDADRYSSTIIAPDGGSLFGVAEEAGVDVIRLRHTGVARRIYPRADLETLTELSAHLRTRGFDIVHTHAGRAGALGRLAGRRVGVRAIVHTLHGFPFNEFQSWPTRNALRAVERRLGRITDYFVTDGTFIASEAVRLGIARPEQVRAMISPVDPFPEATDVARREARALLGIPAGAKVVGTTGRLARQKAPLDMVAAIAGLRRPDVYMVWIGDGDLEAKTKDAIEKAGLRERFLLLGARDDVPRLLPAFDVFAMSSLWEGLPCSVVEAMMCGIPVVATAVNSVPEVIIPGRSGLLARPNDPPTLTRALAYVLDHPVEARRMADVARIQIEQQFRPDLLGPELDEVYEAALEFGARRAARAGIVA